MSDESGFSKWTTGIVYELAFWEEWAKTEGLDWKDDFKKRQVPSALDVYLQSLVRLSAQSSFRILDVGSGPLSVVGTEMSRTSVSLTACDPLARGYEIILSKYGVTGPVKSIFALAEYLSVTFAPFSFDVVHCQNALDHSFDPVRGIHEMLRVVKVGGAVVLRHQINEAENEQYEGFHQFNFCEENGRFVVWNKSARYDIEADCPV